MEPDDPKLLAAHDAAMDAVAHWARTDNFYFSMKEKVQKYFTMHDKMIGATDDGEKLSTRKSLITWLGFELLYPMFRLNEYTHNKAVEQLNAIAEDLSQKNSRSMHR